MNVVGVDVGASKIAAGTVSPSGEILSGARYPTPNSSAELLETIARAILEASDGFEVGGACLAVPGLILARENRVIYSPNLHAIEGIRLKEEVESKAGLPLTIENDNSAAAWGEFRFGAGSGAGHLVFVGLGTGIGGGVVADGSLLSGAQGAAGELGHVTVQTAGPRCACGNRGCLEAFASGSAIGRRAREVAAEHPNVTLVDGGRLLTPDDEWVEELPCLPGEDCPAAGPPGSAGSARAVVRSPDGIHLCSGAFTGIRTDGGCPPDMPGPFRFAAVTADAVAELLGL